MNVVPVSILQELILALGAALALANIAVVVRERRKGTGPSGRRPNMRVVALNIVIGTLLAVWGLASLLISRGGS